MKNYLRTAAAAIALAATPLLSHAAVDIVFDYSYDSSGFFADASRMSILEQAAGDIEARLTNETWTALTPGGMNSLKLNFFDPGNFYGSSVLVTNPLIAADTLRIYVGATDLTDGSLGVASVGYGYGGDASWFNQVNERLNSATNYDPVGGSITFDAAPDGSSWYFGASAPQGGDSYDFYSVAVHEIFHILGFGTSNAFDQDVSDLSFVGEHVQGLMGGPVALYNDGHWAERLVYDGQVPVMVPALANGQRRYATELDYAALADIGYTVTPVPEPMHGVLLLAGLPLVASFARRRRQAA